MSFGFQKVTKGDMIRTKEPTYLFSPEGERIEVATDDILVVLEIERTKGYVGLMCLHPNEQISTTILPFVEFAEGFEVKTNETPTKPPQESV